MLPRSSNKNVKSTRLRLDHAAAAGAAVAAKCSPTYVDGSSISKIELNAFDKNRKISLAEAQVDEAAGHQKNS